MGRYADPTEKAIRCPLKGHQRPLLACLACRHFPCRAMTEERLALLRTSPFVQLDTKNSKLLPRRHVMYIFRMTSGELRDAPDDFSPDAPDFDQLADVEEVLVIGKVLVKQLRLVAKPREERDRIRNFQPPVTGEIIMQTYGLPPCRAVGEIKERIKNAILDGEIRNDYDEAYALMERLAAERGLTKAQDG